MICAGNLKRRKTSFVYECQLCGFKLSYSNSGWWDPISKEIEDTGYTDSGHSSCLSVEEKSYWFSHRNQIIGSMINKYPPEGPIWDIGGGNGFVTRYLETMGYETVLVEPGSAGVKAAKDRGVKNIINSAFEDLKLPPGAIKSAGIFDVLEHVDNAIGFLSKIAESLSNNGLLYITVPAYNFLWSDSDIGHVKRFTIHMLRKEAKLAGLTEIYSSYFMVPLAAPIFIFKSIPYLLGRRRKLKEIVNELVIEDEGSMKGSVVKKMLQFERDRIPGRRFPFGASCIATYKKI